MNEKLKVRQIRCASKYITGRYEDSLFVADCYKEVACQKVKFADDGTIWKTGKDWLKLLEELKTDFRHVCLWASRWRVKLIYWFCVFHISKLTNTYSYSINAPLSLFCFCHVC